MNLNWKVRFKNGKWLMCFAAQIVGLVYYVLGVLNIAPAITQSTVMQIVEMILMIMGSVGVITDPTVDGLEDSSRAMSYQYPAVNCSQEKDLTNG